MFILNIVYCILLFFILPFLAYRIIVKGKYRDSLSERWGKLNKNFTSCIWVHGVSVGEIKAAQPLVQGLALSFPQYPIVISATSTFGRKVARELYPEHTVVAFPFDFTWSVRSFFQHFSPKCILLMELELWPNFLAEAKKRNVPVLSINSRLSEHSFQGYKRLGRLFYIFTKAILCFSVQHKIYAERFHKLGIENQRIVISGNIKFDALKMEIPQHEVENLKKELQLTEEPVFIIGSTHAPEERILLQSFIEVQKHWKHLRLIIVPRNPARCDEISQWCQEFGLNAVRRSQLPSEQTLSCSSVILGDVMGELQKLYSVATFVFIGGSIIPHGGQNFMEAAALGKPVVCGRFMDNFPDIRFFIEQKAVMQVQNPENLTEVFCQLLSDKNMRDTMIAKSREIIQNSQGSTERNLLLVRSFLDAVRQTV
ncbi:MAG: 3-deoxy-D-manno-octulosonic acid transferase [Planctomycetes bacterium]|nr:3-deoxy-D-manno-octulosonic acid transferase [Planctomycetota bacterium]HPY75309.1 3-deoxy-D-manno-octulosonic acid transferase [Planctomycetota bacterium]HQB00915.1 3-deoxy-D-manno-octulosonic acid transferase [Planctomycetota bacterium]